MNQLSPHIHILRSRFLLAIRKFMENKGLLETDTPHLRATGGMEPFLDPFSVEAGSGERGYLITSPEYSLKQALAALAGEDIAGVYEIAHAFRSGEKGSLHTKEFLMLEYYLSGRDDNALIEYSKELFQFLNGVFGRDIYIEGASVIYTMEELFLEKTGRGYSRPELLDTLQEHGIAHDSRDRYDDLFFLVFLNLIESGFDAGPYFVTHWPPELASLARIVDGVARRVEIYWRGVEIGNGFYELNDSAEQGRRFAEEQALRRALGKEVFAMDDRFLSALDRLPECAGISIGLDRLFMIYTGQQNLKLSSPYYTA